MATVTVDVNGRPYSVGCADGQEERVRALAQQFDDHVRQIARDVGQVGDLRLFLMAALLVSDELADIRGQLARALKDGGNGAEAPPEADLDAAIARLNSALGGLESRVRDLKAKTEAKPAAPAGDDDLFASGPSAREQELEAAAREASDALDKAAAEIRAVLEEA